MGENRNRYSSAPLHDIKKRPGQKQAAHQPPKKVGDFQPDAAISSFSALQVLLTIILPLLFVVSLLVRNAGLYILFSAAAAFCLAAMWLLNAFVPNARTTLSVIHIAMILVALFAVWIGAPSEKANSVAPTGDLTSIFAPDSSVSLVGLSREMESSQPAPTENPGSASLAQQRLDQFMSAWMRVDYPGMVSYALPAWVAAQENSERAMFQIRSNRTPVDYRVIDVSGSDADNSRTIFMQATVDKNNGSAPVKYNFQVLMVRINDLWYVDPNSLTSSQIVQETAELVPTVTISPLVTANPDMVLYYNPDGGSYYHVDPNCRSINQKYLPLTASFYFRDVSAERFKNLLPCVVCHAPSRQ